jgi:hypothetical protein
LLVYGHPNSTTDGYDDFFGTLMRDMDTLARVFLTDCPLSRYQKIAPDGRSFSLHAWGNPFWALKLPFAKWRPSRKSKSGPYGWLVRRAAIQEGKTAQSVMNKWHALCQRRWLEATRPRIVTWPWENYGWERVFVRDAKLVGAKTIGYQHTVVGRHMINHAPASNPDGMLSLPDQIFCNGPAGRDQLSTWGIPQSRLKISGALRYKPASGVTYASSGPVFVALPMKHKLANEIVRTLQAIKAPDLTFLLKVHPMTTLAFEDTEFLKRTTVSLQQQPGLSAVLYAASTVGLEALLAGLPTLRFIPTSTIAVDILSPPAAAVPVHAGNIEAALKNLQRPPKIPVEAIFSPPQLDVWQDALMRDQL